VVVLLRPFQNNAASGGQGKTRPIAEPLDTHVQLLHLRQGLNNLLWVYPPTTADVWGVITSDQYVDIVGFSCYY